MEFHVQSYAKELKKTLILAAPITAGHVSQMLLGITDTLMIGRVGVVELAAAALSHTGQGGYPIATGSRHCPRRRTP